MHRARALDGSELACKLQYPDMQSAVEADLSQLQLLFAIRKRFDPAIDTTEIAVEIGARLREELDYVREAKHVALYATCSKDEDAIRVPNVWPELSTGRLLTLDWLTGRKLLEHKDDPLATRNRLATAMFTAWWFPFSRFGVIHGDPHLGNYTVFDDAKGKPAGINLLDYGCIRIFPPSFVGGVVDLYRGLLRKDDALVVHAYETWGFKRLNRELIDALNIWARFIYGPLLDDRVRTIADGVKPSEYGRKEAFRVHQALKARGPVTVPREFVFMDRAAIGLGAVFLHLGGGTEFLPLVQRGDRAIYDRGRGRAASRRARQGRPGSRPPKGSKPSAAGCSRAAVALAGRNCANPCAPATFRATRRLPPWPTTAPSNTPPPPATTMRRTRVPTSASCISRCVGILYVVTILFGLAIGGVMGHWFLAALIFAIGLLGAIPGLLSGATTPSYVSFVICFLIFAFTGLSPH